jgi:hypothetical protein
MTTRLVSWADWLSAEEVPPPAESVGVGDGLLGDGDGLLGAVGVGLLGAVGVGDGLTVGVGVGDGVGLGVGEQLAEGLGDGVWLPEPGVGPGDPPPSSPGPRPPLCEPCVELPKTFPTCCNIPFGTPARAKPPTTTTAMTPAKARAGLSHA